MKKSNIIDKYFSINEKEEKLKEQQIKTEQLRAGRRFFLIGFIGMVISLLFSILEIVSFFKYQNLLNYIESKGLYEYTDLFLNYVDNLSIFESDVFLNSINFFSLNHYNIYWSFCFIIFAALLTKETVFSTMDEKLNENYKDSNVLIGLSFSALFGGTFILSFFLNLSSDHSYPLIEFLSSYNPPLANVVFSSIHNLSDEFLLINEYYEMKNYISNIDFYFVLFIMQFFMFYHLNALGRKEINAFLKYEQNKNNVVKDVAFFEGVFFKYKNYDTLFSEIKDCGIKKNKLTKEIIHSEASMLQVLDLLKQDISKKERFFLEKLIKNYNNIYINKEEAVLTEKFIQYNGNKKNFNINND